MHAGVGDLALLAVDELAEEAVDELRHRQVIEAGRRPLLAAIDVVMWPVQIFHHDVMRRSRSTALLAPQSDGWLVTSGVVTALVMQQAQLHHSLLELGCALLVGVRGKPSQVSIFWVVDDGLGD